MLREQIEQEIESHKRVLVSTNGWVDRDGVAYAEVSREHKLKAEGVIEALEWVKKNL